MPVQRVREDRGAVEQGLEASAIERREPRQVVVTHLVDGDEQDEARRPRGAGSRNGPKAKDENPGDGDGQESQEQASHPHKNQRSFLTASSYARRTALTLSISETSAGGTSHHDS